jgi:hypothetical protein
VQGERAVAGGAGAQIWPRNDVRDADAEGVDNKIVSNSTTHVYGRMNAPTTIDAIHDLMAAKGGAADDIGKLSKGEFYYSTEGSLRPLKVRTPLCLSWHSQNPPTAEEVIQKARSKRG